jgi:hypothetical protein
MPKIDRLWAYIQEDTGPDDEGVIGVVHPIAMPLIGADMERVEALRPAAQMVADTTGKPVKLLAFSVRTEVAVLRPCHGERNGH